MPELGECIEVRVAVLEAALTAQELAKSWSLFSTPLALGRSVKLTGDWFIPGG